MKNENKLTKPHVLLLFGGESTEHEVSIASARNVYAAINTEKYEVTLGYIDRAGVWWLVSNVSPEALLEGNEQLVPGLGLGGFTALPGGTMVRPDVILPVLHGKNGEDGAVAALGQLLHIPVVGCDMTSSAIAMDKVLTKQIAAQCGIPIVPYVAVRRGETLPEDETAKLGDMLFVKPARAGSSVGVTKVKRASELEAAIATAHQHDQIALIERAVDAREIELAILGNPPQHRVSNPGEIIPDREFYDYESKYDSASTSRAIIPADMPGETAALLRDYAAKAYAALGCRGLARVDFFLCKDGSVYLNEINTFPGFTNISMYPKLWQEAGLEYGVLIDEIITSALD